MIWHAGLVDAYIAADGVAPVASPSSSVQLGSAPDSAQGSGPVSGSADRLSSSSRQSGSAQHGRSRAAFLLDAALRSMAGRNFAAARARLALCRAALLAQAEQRGGAAEPVLEHRDGSGTAATGSGAAAASSTVITGGVPGVGNCGAAAAGGKGAVKESSDARGRQGRAGSGATAAGSAAGADTADSGDDALACQLGAVCGSEVRTLFCLIPSTGL